MTTLSIKIVSRPVATFHNDWWKARVDQLEGSDGECLIEYAGRTCYDSLGTGRSSDDYHKHLLEVGHGSVLEHAQYSFLVSGVSRGLTHELIRHRAGTAVSQRSTRYVDESESPWVTHPVLREIGLPCSLSDDIARLEADARSIYDRVCTHVMDSLVNIGVPKATAKKQARGAARGYLGNALETELVWSANVRALRNVIEQRGSLAADAEIREFALALLGIMVEECPAYFSDFEVHTDETTGWSYVTTTHHKV